MTLKDKVETVLKQFPKTRDSDPDLTFMIIYQYHKEEMIKIGDKFYISTKILKEIREDNVKRHRAVIQNVENRYLPKNIEVVKKRKINEVKWREQLGYSTNI